jgi:hypothetical protein
LLIIRTPLIVYKRSILYHSYFANEELISFFLKYIEILRTNNKINIFDKKFGCEYKTLLSLNQ